MRCKPNQRVLLLADEITTPYAMQFVGGVRTTVSVHFVGGVLSWVLEPPLPPRNPFNTMCWRDSALLPLDEPPPADAVPRVTEDALQG